MAAVVCSYYRTGFCKYEDRCRNLHINEMCQDTNCSNDSCQLRHPTPCRYFSLYGSCKFADKCAYRHENLLLEELRLVKNEVVQITSKLELVQKALDNLPRVYSTSIANDESASSFTTSSMPSTSPPFQIPQVDGCSDSKFKRYPCQSCSLVFHSAEDLQFHDSYKFYCDICTICFATKKDLNVHEEDFHPGFYSRQRLRKKNCG